MIFQRLTPLLLATALGCVASAIATGGGAAVSAATGANSDWQAERVLGLISGLALALYGTYLFKGWWNDRQEERLARKVDQEGRPVSGKAWTLMVGSQGLRNEEHRVGSRLRLRFRGDCPGTSTPILHAAKRVEKLAFHKNFSL